MNKDYAQFIVNQTIEAYSKINQNGVYRDYLPLLKKDIEKFVNLSQSGDRILDLGCGDAPLLRYIKDPSVHYFGVDTCPDFIKKDRKKYGKRGKFEIVRPFSLPFSDSYFKGVYSFSVLHHIPSIELRLSFLREAKRVLVKNGFMVLTVWNLFSIPKLKKVIDLFNNIHQKIKSCPWDINDIFLPFRNSQGKIITPRYFHAFTLNEVENIVVKSKLSIAEEGYLDRVKVKKANIYLILRNSLS